MFYVFLKYLLLSEATLEGNLLYKFNNIVQKKHLVFRDAYITADTKHKTYLICQTCIIFNQTTKMSYFQLFFKSYIKKIKPYAECLPHTFITARFTTKANPNTFKYDVYKQLLFSTI